MLNYFDACAPLATGSPTTSRTTRRASASRSTTAGKWSGELYREGTLSGYFDTNEKEAWVPAWYCTRRRALPARRPVVLRDPQPGTLEPRRTLSPWNTTCARASRSGARCRSKARQDDHLPAHGQSARSSRPRRPIDGLPIFRFEEFAAAFDDDAVPDLPLTYPSVDPSIANPLDVNFGNLIRLEGYDIDYPKPLRPGDTIRLTLYWRGQQPIRRTYKVFNQMYAADGPMQAQRDGYPVCDGRETWRWDPGELITDVYDIPVSCRRRRRSLPALHRLLPGRDGRPPARAGRRRATRSARRSHVTDIRIGDE